MFRKVTDSIQRKGVEEQEGKRRKTNKQTKKTLNKVRWAVCVCVCVCVCVYNPMNYVLQHEIRKILFKTLVQF